MKRLFSIAIAQILFFLLFTGSSFAVDVTMFGPQQFERHKGKPTVSTDTFWALPKEAQIIIENGELIGNKRVNSTVSSATITLNGTELFGPNDFNKNVHFLEKTILLTEDNTLSVELNSSPNSYLTIKVVQDVPPPTASISANPDEVHYGENSNLSWETTIADNCVIKPSIGNVPCNGATPVSVSPSETTTYTLTATGLGGTTSATITVKYINTAPVAISQSLSTNEDTPALIVLTGSDIDGDPLTYTTLTSPTNGVISGIAPNLSYTPNLNFNGTDSFTFSVNDKTVDSQLATVSITVNAVNDTPEADSQTLTTDEDVPVAITLTGTDVDGDVLSYQVKNGPANGTLSGSVPELIYSPNPDFNGSDSFTFTTNDGLVGSSPATVTININPINDYPIANGGPDQTVFRKDTVSLDAGDSTDVDGDLLFYQWSFISSPNGSSSTFSGNSSDKPSFIPDLVGTYEVQLIVSDGTLTSTDSMTITVKHATVIIPTLTGLSQDGAITLIQSSGLVLGSLSNSYSDVVPANYVMSQSLVAGDVVDENTLINLIISLGPQYSEPTVQLTTTPAIITAGEASVLSWTSTDADSVTITPKVGSVAATGTTIVSPFETTTFTITAVGPGGTSTATATATVTVNNPYPPPTVSFFIWPTTPIYVGQPAYLIWNTTNASSLAIDNGIGTIYWPKQSRKTFPTQTTIYTMTAIGLGGTVTESVTIQVNTGYPPPTVSFSAVPDSIQPGESAVLQWTSDYADTVIIDQGIGAVPDDGTTNISPTETTTYTIIATGLGGTATSSTTVTVIYPEPTVQLTAAPNIITAGESTILSWSSTNADSFSITPEVGNVSANGTVAVTPVEPTTYTITATGPDGTTATAQTKVKVLIGPLPAVNFSADPEIIQIGESSTLSWSTTNTDSVFIDQDIGDVTASGSMIVSPNETTTYPLTATGPGGTFSTFLIISVEGTPPPPVVKILEPFDQEYTSQSSVLVHGTVDTYADHISVSVNGQRADVNGHEFFIDSLSLEPGANLVDVQVVDSFRNQDQATITVNYEQWADTEWIELLPDHPAVFLPMEIKLKVVPHLLNDVNPNSAVLTYTGPGAGAVSLISPEEYSLRFDTPGIYTINYSISDIQGNVYDGSTMLSVMEPFTEDDWQGMHDAIEELDDIFLARLGSMDITVLRQQILESAQTNQDFSSVALSAGALCLVYKGFIPIILDLPDPEGSVTDGSSAGSKSAVAPPSGKSFNQDHLERLLKTKMCKKCNLEGANLAGVDLSGGNLEGANLKGANLQKADLKRISARGADFESADLQNANLYDAIFADSNFKNANLKKADMRQAIFKRASLESADMQGAKLDHCGLQNANLQKADLQNAEMVAASLGGANLQQTNLYKTDLRNADLQKANLKNADLREADLRLAKLEGADLRGVGVKLLGAKLKGAFLEGALLDDAVREYAEKKGGQFTRDTRIDSDDPAIDGSSGGTKSTTAPSPDKSFNQEHLDRLLKTKICKKCNLEGANLAGVDLSRGNIDGANLKGADLHDSNLRGLRAWKTDFESANLHGANLQDADMGNANLHKANLKKARLQKVYLFGANLQEANLQEANLYLASMQEANLQKVNLFKTKLRLVSLSNANLQGANLEKADLRKAILHGANLRRANLHKADLREAQFEKCDLRGAKLQRARMKGTFLYKAMLDGKDLEYAKKSGAQFNRVIRLDSE
ncbi:MAG: pentapeptide repeat-containing protein [Thermodesulfobacteriota bacterium]